MPPRRKRSTCSGNERVLIEGAFHRAAYERIDGAGKSRLTVRGQGGPAYVYGRYDERFIEKLYSVGGMGHALLLFEPADTTRMLRHINIFDSFSFTLVPTSVRPAVYEEIYSFFMFRPLSAVFITWMAALICRPAPWAGGFAFGGRKPRGRLASCREDCPLRERGCTRTYLMTEVFHPLRGCPTPGEMDAFCRVHLLFSCRIVEDALGIPDSDLDLTERTAKSIGIRSRYWLDPFQRF